MGCPFGGQLRHDTRGVADTTAHSAGEPDPSSGSQHATTEWTTTSTGRVRFPFVRWALAPRTTWHARHLAADFGPGMDARTSWAMARLARHPEEHVYAMRHLSIEVDAD